MKKCYICKGEISLGQSYGIDGNGHYHHTCKGKQSTKRSSDVPDEPKQPRLSFWRGTPYGKRKPTER